MRPVGGIDSSTFSNAGWLAMLWAFECGVFLLLAGFLLAVYTGNLLGVSRKQRESIERLKLQKSLASSERSYLKYIALNGFVRVLSIALCGAGALLVLLALIVHPM